ncbi:RNA polymerase sigma factor [Larkinella arboricola]
MPRFTELEIITGLKTGTNVESITVYLYDTYFQSIRNLVWRGGGNKQDSEDLFQDTLIILIEIVADDRYDTEGPASLQTYLYGIAYRLWLKRRQRRGKQESWEQMHVDAYKQVKDDIQRYEDQLTASQLLDQIGEPCKALLYAFYVEDLSLKEIAEQLGKEEATIKLRKFRCLQKLKERLNL